MKKKERIKQLVRERDHARELACQYEAMLSEYQRIEPLRFTKDDALDPALMIEILDRTRFWDAPPSPELETFMRVARRIMEEPE